MSHGPHHHRPVTEMAGDRDVFTAPRTSVVKSWDTTAKDGTWEDLWFYTNPVWVLPT